MLIRPPPIIQPMGEKNTSEGGGDTTSTTDTNQGKNKEGEEEHGNEIVLKVDMQCEACAKKVIRVLRTYPGVEDVGVDRKANTVVVKAGKTVQAAQLCERIQKKRGRKAQIISPLPKPNRTDQPQPKGGDQQRKDQPPSVTTVTLQVHTHCEACAQILRKRIRKIKGIESVETDLGKGQVIVKGIIADPSALVKQVYKRTGKQATIVVIPDEEKKQDQKKGDHGLEQKKDIVEGSGNKQEVEAADEMTLMMGEPLNRYEYYWPSRYNHNVEYYNNLVSYHPQVFSDENPNACSII